MGRQNQAGRLRWTKTGNPDALWRWIFGGGVFYGSARVLSGPLLPGLLMVAAWGMVFVGPQAAAASDTRGQPSTVAAARDNSLVTASPPQLLAAQLGRFGVFRSGERRWNRRWEGRGGYQRQRPQSDSAIRREAASTTTPSVTPSAPTPSSPRGGAGPVYSPSSSRARYLKGPSGSSAGVATQAQPAPQTESTLRRTPAGGTLQGSRTQEGDTTTRDITYTNPSGVTAQHHGSVTTYDGGFTYSGAGGTSKGLQTSESATGTTQDGRIERVDASVTGHDATGRSFVGQGQAIREGDTLNLSGDAKSSTGESLHATGQAIRTESGFTAQGAYTGSKGGSGQGIMVRDPAGVHGEFARIDQNNKYYTQFQCQGGNCVAEKTQAPLVVYDDDAFENGAVYYYYPPYVYGPAFGYPGYYGYGYGYPYYPGPVVVYRQDYDGLRNPYGGTIAATEGQQYVNNGPACNLAPAVRTSIRLYDHSATDPATIPIASAPGVIYELDGGKVVYSTGYPPKGLYTEQRQGCYMWVPGVAKGTAEVHRLMGRMYATSTKLRDTTVYSYELKGATVYLTADAPPFGIYSQATGALYAWLPGVKSPTGSERDTIARAAMAHETDGARTLRSLMEKRRDSASDKRPWVDPG